jgi:serine/threonine-protein kinase
LIAGKYRIESLLGTGAMGTVWVATHATLGSKVAVKLVSTDFARSAETKSRFLAEAKAAAALRSRYVVQMFDSGVTEDGAPYIVMEYLNGESLEERITRLGRISLEQVIRIIGQVAKGLQRAHASNIVHRDLKPANIFVTLTDDGEEVAKILDFGIAKMDHDERDYKATATGVIMGTPLYMSPEQARGLRTVGPSSDVYSLGMVTYCALVGDVPYHAESFGDLVYMVCTQELPQTSDVAPWLPPALDGWFRRACHKDQSQRYQTPEEMYEALLVAANVGRTVGLASLPDTAQGFAFPRGLTPPHGFAMDTGGMPVALGSSTAQSPRVSAAHATLPFTDSKGHLPGAKQFDPNGSGPSAGDSTPRVREAAMQQTLLDSGESLSGRSWVGSGGTHDGGVVASGAPKPRARWPWFGGAAVLLALCTMGFLWSRPDAVAPTQNVGAALDDARTGLDPQPKAGPSSADLTRLPTDANLGAMGGSSATGSGSSSAIGAPTQAGADGSSAKQVGEEPAGAAAGGRSTGKTTGKTGGKPPKGTGKTGGKAPPSNGTSGGNKSLTGGGSKQIDLGF